MGIPPDRRNWRGIFIALLVIAIVFSLIILSIFLLTPGRFFLLTFSDNNYWYCSKYSLTNRFLSSLSDEENLRYYGTPLTLNDVLSEKYRWNKFNGSWHNGRCAFNFRYKLFLIIGKFDCLLWLGYELIYRDVNDGISLMNVKTLKRQTLLSNTILVSISKILY